MSQLEVDKIIPQSGTTLTIGDSGDTVNFADGTNLSIDTNTLFIDSTNNRVGIANNSPSETLEVSGNIKLGDNNKIKLGTGNDLEIYHDGSNSYVSDAGTGNLFVNTNGTKIALISDLSSSNGKMAEFTKDGAVELYHDNSKKFETAADGIFVNGVANVDVGGEPPSTGMIKLQANGTDRQLRISPPSNSANGKIDYRGGNLTFQDDGTEVARFQDTTAFLVGKTSTGLTGAGVVLRTGGELFVTKEGDMVNLNRLNSEGVIQYFRKDGAVRGLISSTSSGIAFGTSLNNGCGIHLVSNAVLPSTSSGGTSDGLHDLGASSSRFKDIYAGGKGIFSRARSNTLGNPAIEIAPSDTVVGYGFRLEQTNNDLVVEKSAPSGSELEIARFKVGGGIALGGTGTANKLDDYEEGTWTPTFDTGELNGFSGSATVNDSVYTKIGNLCHIFTRIQFASSSGTLAVGDKIVIQPSSLPFSRIQTDGQGTGSAVFHYNASGNGLASVTASGADLRIFVHNVIGSPTRAATAFVAFTYQTT